MSQAAKFTIHFEDDDGFDQMTIGVFETRKEAADWLFKFADTHCEGCDVNRDTNEGFERIVVHHAHGATADLRVIAHSPNLDGFIADWNV